MNKLLKQLFCKHEWQWYTVNKSSFQVISGERKVQACPKCEKIKRNSEYFNEYD